MRYRAAWLAAVLAALGACDAGSSRDDADGDGGGGRSGQSGGAGGADAGSADPCRSQCPLAVEGDDCREEPFDTFPSLEVTLGEWSATLCIDAGSDAFPYLLEARCEDGTRVLYYGSGHSIERRYYDASGAFLALETAGDGGQGPSCQSSAYWPVRVACSNAIATTVVCGSGTFAEGDPVPLGDSTTDGACSPCIGEPLRWGLNGGRVRFVDRSELADCNAFRRTRTPITEPGSEMLDCARGVPCMGSGLHGIADVLRALAHPDVEQALMLGTVLFGEDDRTVDSPVFRIERAGNVVDLGSPCTNAGCTPIPEGVAALAELLRSIDDEQLGLSPCVETFD